MIPSEENNQELEVAEIRAQKITVERVKNGWIVQVISTGDNCQVCDYFVYSTAAEMVKAVEQHTLEAN